MNQFQCDFPNCRHEETLLFNCSYCGNHFCTEHHLPENHSCGLKPKEAPWFVRPLKTTSKELSNEPSPKRIPPQPIHILAKVKSFFKFIGLLFALILSILVIGFFLFGFVVAPFISRIDPSFFDNIGNFNWNNSSFKSVPELVSYLQNDNISSNNYASNYTCVNFAKDFIQQARANDYQCFTYHAMFDKELEKFNDAISSIRTEKGYYFTLIIPDAGHAVVLTTINGTQYIIDPQTDIIMDAKNFTVLSEGEIVK